MMIDIQIGVEKLLVDDWRFLDKEWILVSGPPGQKLVIVLVSDFDLILGACMDCLETPFLYFLNFQTYRGYDVR